MAADQDETKAGPQQRPSVTIDLTAASVGAKPQTQKADSPKPEPERAARTAGRRESDGVAAGATDTWRQNAFAGVIGGVVALVILMLLQAVGLLPAPGRSAANQAIEQAKAASEASAGLDRRLTAVEAMTEGIPAIRADLKAISDKTASLDAIRNTIATHADVDALASSVAALGKRVDATPPGVTQDDLAALTERLQRLEVAVAAGGNANGDSTAAVSSLAAQLADAQAEVKALGERVAAAETRAASVIPGGSEAATRGLAIASLRRAAEGGSPFAPDVDMVAALGVDGDDIATLRPLAEKGVTAAAALAAEFPAVADAILGAAAASDPDANFFQRVLGSLVTIRPAGPVAGNDPAAIVSRMKDDVAKGDLAAALTERDGLPPAGKDASADWAAKAVDRVALDALVERIARTLDPPKAG